MMSKLFFVFISAFLQYYLCEGYRIKNSEDVVAYLSRFGYLEAKSKNSLNDQDVKKALKEFQSITHLNPSGIINHGTLRMMNRPRCGNRDVREDEILDENTFLRTRNKRSAKPLGKKRKKWDKKILKYKILKFPSHKSLNPKIIQSEFDKAFKYWEKETNLRFKKVVDDSSQVDIKIKFALGFHGDYEAFDGPGKILAHGFYPVRGALHFDDEENWTTKIKKGFYDIRTVAVHEIGHALGLHHTNNTEAVMYHQYSGHRSKRHEFKLHPEDVLSIQTLYGKKKDRKIKNRGVANAKPNLCEDAQIDAISRMADKFIYIFKGDYYFRLNSLTDNISSEYPQLINSTFHNLPSNLDTVLTMKNNKTYFFKGPLYWRSTGTVMDGGYPKSISVHFKKVSNNVNGACIWSGNSTPYFFKSSTYTKYNDNPNLMNGYPRLISDYWPGLPNSIDDCFQASNNATYFFKRGKFWLFHHDSSFVEATTYPKLITDHWFQCPQRKTGHR